GRVASSDTGSTSATTGSTRLTWNGSRRPSRPSPTRASSSASANLRRSIPRKSDGGPPTARPDLHGTVVDPLGPGLLSARRMHQPSWVWAFLVTSAPPGATPLRRDLPVGKARGGRQDGGGEDDGTNVVDRESARVRCRPLATRLPGQCVGVRSPGPAPPVAGL